MKLELGDSRRLTGANLYWSRPSAVIDVVIEGVDPARVVEAWREQATRLLRAVGHAGERTCERLYPGGASLLVSAPIDQLYSMCELNELAWAGALHACGVGEAPDFEAGQRQLAQLFGKERNPPLIALQAAAREHGIPFLWDDDQVSVGYGAASLCWTPDALPEPAAVDWSELGSVPVALVTGTNGKSTTVRMAASILSAAGYAAGLTSTDFIRVGDRVIDTGDYSGTGGARLLLRQPDLQAAVLEVARGGLLRRGLGVEHADVAVITNIAADHLGEYGILTVDDLRPAKFIVRRALGPHDPLVLNADDEGLAVHGESLGGTICWFSLDEHNHRVRSAIERGNPACFLRGEWLAAARDGEVRDVVEISDIPAARGGVVRHNLANALAAMALARALGVEDEAIRAGLARFRGDESDNPGRGNWFERELEDGPVRILVDFAHNEHGMRALAETVRGVPAERVVLLMGQAGDRLDQEIGGLVRAACGMRPDRLLVAELPGYERGRQPFEVPALIRRQALEYGVGEESITMFDSPREAVAAALEDARAGDLLVLLALTQRGESLALIHEFIGEGDG